jgi:hypothetical protein
MNYQRIYDNLISYRQNNPATGYTEKHHILMKSMGGSDDTSNLVVLTGREHWIAHILLYKIHKNSQTIHACHMMAMRCEERSISYIKNSRLYEEIRKHHSKLASKRMKISQSGECNSQYGTRWMCNIELQENKKILKEDKIPEGWILGRNKWKNIEIIFTCVICNCTFLKLKCSKTYKTCSSECLHLLKIKNRKGKTLDKKTRKKLSDSAKIRMRKQIDSGNMKFSSVDTVWINNGTKSARIEKNELPPDGWKFGRHK